MKIGTIFNDLDLNKCYSRHDREQHSKGHSHRSDTLGNTNNVNLCFLAL